MKPCIKCKKNNFFRISDRACGGSYFQLNDHDEISGYLPNLPGICDSDGCGLTICLECGWIVGFNLASLKKGVASFCKEEGITTSHKSNDNDESEELDIKKYKSSTKKNQKKIAVKKPKKVQLQKKSSKSKPKTSKQTSGSKTQKRKYSQST
jgi:hypothetical protein